MKDIDPEVAALLDDIPKPELPPVLIAEGWGHMTMHQADLYGVGRRKQPSTEQQPIYAEHCAQCGRPITTRRHMWNDHAGRTLCEGGVIDPPIWDYHFTEAEQPVIEAQIVRARESAEQLTRYEKQLRDDLIKQVYGPVPEPKPTSGVKVGPCGQAKYTHSCDHRCSQLSGHFGFHECFFCRYLWK